jgi:hypothetical protein
MKAAKWLLLFVLFLCGGLFAESSKNIDAAFVIGLLTWPVCAAVYRSKMGVAVP